MTSPGALAPYLLPELGDLIQEYEGAHFRHRKSSLFLWVKAKIFERLLGMREGKEEYNGVELKAAPGLWRVRFGPNKYKRMMDGGCAHINAWRSLILYTGILKELPSERSFPPLPEDWAIESSEVVLCSQIDEKIVPIFSFIVKGQLIISTYGARCGAFVFPIHDVDADSKNITEKYNILYNALLEDVKRMSGKEVKLKGTALGFSHIWDPIPLITDLRDIITYREDELIVNSGAVVFHPFSGAMPIWLERENAPWVWRVRDAITEIDAIDPNYINTIPLDRVLSLHKPFITPLSK